MAVTFDTTAIEASYTELLNRMQEIDNQLGVTGISRTAVLNRHAQDCPAAVEWATAVSDMIKSLDPDTAVAYIRALHRATNQTWKKLTDAFVERNVPKVERVEGQEDLSDEATVGLKTEFNTLAEQARAFYGVLAFSGKDFPEPPKNKRMGVPGPRGKRLKGNWTWNIDGAVHDGLAMGKAAAVVGISAADLRAAIVAKYGEAFDFTAPPESFSVTVTNGDKTHEFSAMRTDSELDEDSLDDEDDEDEDEDDDI